MTTFHDAAWMAEQIGTSVDWIYEHQDDIPHHKIGRRLRFTDANVAQYERQTLHTPRPMETTGKKSA